MKECTMLDLKTIRNYNIEQKIYLIKKFELFLLENGVNKSKLLRMLNISRDTFFQWKWAKTVPGPDCCYKLESVMSEWVIPDKCLVNFTEELIQEHKQLYLKRAVKAAAYYKRWSNNRKFKAVLDNKTV